MIDDLFNFFIFFGGFMSLTIALGQILENEKKPYNYLFAALLYSLGTLQILDGMLVAGKLSKYSFLVFWYLPCMALLGPLFYLAFKSANTNSFRFKKIYYLHFIFAIMLIPFLIPLMKLDPATKMSFIMQTPNFASNDPLFRLYSGLQVAVIANLLGYMIYFVRECLFMLNIKHISDKKMSPYLRLIMLINFPLEIFFFASVIVLSMVDHPKTLFFAIIQSLTAMSFLITLVVFIMEKRNINFFKLLHNEIENRRYETSKVKNLDVETLLARIESLMQDEKIFCDEDLSVNSLARELLIEPYQLSQIINENYNKNFKNYINEYRIEEAKKILLTEKNRTIISVAYAVGFNSTTVFYEWFNRITGESPKKFRSSTKENNQDNVELVAAIND